MKKNIALIGLVHALAATAYIAIVIFIMIHSKTWFGSDTPWTGMAVLMLFVLSAGVMASLAFLRPALWYLDGKKKEALKLLLWTLIFFLMMTVIVFVCMAIIR